MSKAVLVMDMPKSCDECNFIDELYHYCNIPWFGKDVSDYVACRHEDCPLRPMPEKREEHPAEYYEFGTLGVAYVSGYNNCIDEILGGAN